MKVRNEKSHQSPWVIFSTQFPKFKVHACQLDSERHPPIIVLLLLVLPNWTHSLRFVKLLIIYFKRFDSYVCIMSKKNKPTCSFIIYLQNHYAIEWNYFIRVKNVYAIDISVYLSYVKYYIISCYSFPQESSVFDWRDKIIIVMDSLKQYIFVLITFNLKNRWLYSVYIIIEKEALTLINRYPIILIK